MEEGGGCSEEGASYEVVSTKVSDVGSAGTCSEKDVGGACAVVEEAGACSIFEASMNVVEGVVVGSTVDCCVELEVVATMLDCCAVVEGDGCAVVEIRDELDCVVLDEDVVGSAWLVVDTVMDV